jgi:hypothetical protein
MAFTQNGEKRIDNPLKESKFKGVDFYRGGPLNSALMHVNHVFSLNTVKREQDTKEKDLRRMWLCNNMFEVL